MPLRSAQPGYLRRAEGLFVNAPSIPDNLTKHPRLGQWLDVAPDGRLRAYSGKVDLGQGISHALRLIVAQELQVQFDQVVMVRATTSRSPDEAVTSGSLSIQHSGAALRYAAVHLREACRSRFAQQHGVPLQAVELQNGIFSLNAGRSEARYQDLVDDSMLAAPIEPVHLQPSDADRLRLGTQPRPDIEAKVFGQFEFINDLVLPDMCFGQVFRPKTLLAQMNEVAARRLEDELTRLTGVIQMIRDGILIGVLAEAENVLAKAARKVQAVEPWSGVACVAPAGAIAGWLKS